MWRFAVARKKWVAGAEPSELISVDACFARFQSGGSCRTGEVVALGSGSDHIGKQKYEERDAQKDKTPSRQVWLQHGPSHHQGVKQHANKECRRHDKDPDKTKLLRGGACLIPTIFHGQQSGGQKHKAHEIEIPNAPDAIELKKSAIDKSDEK